jgi:hypothetical protein
MASKPDSQLHASLVEAIAEFVRSDYAMRLCRYCDADPTGHGQIGGMFESVQLIDEIIDVKLTAPFTQKSDQLLDHLAEHLRYRVPQIKRMEYTINGGWGSTRTWILSSNHGE